MHHLTRMAAAGLLLTAAGCATGPATIPTTGGAPVALPGPPPAASPRPETSWRASPPATAAAASPIVVPVDPARLATLSRHAVAATVDGRPRACEGVALVDLLRAAGAMPGAPSGGDALDRYVQVDARDGGRVLFSLAEVDPTLGAAPVFVIDRCLGAPLPASEGPLRLWVPRDARDARALRQLAAITVIAAP